MKKTLIALIPITLLCLGGYFGLQLLRPEIEKFVLLQIRELSAQNLPVEIQAEKFSFRLLGPVVELKGIQIAAKSKSQLGFTDIEIETIQAQLDFLQLLGGKISISNIIVTHPEVEFDIDQLAPQQSQASPLHVKALFKLLDRLPLQRFAINDLSLGIQSKKSNFSFDSEGIDIYIANNNQQITGQLELPHGDLTVGHFSVPLSAHLSTSLTEALFSIRQLQLTTLSSSLLFSGDFTDLNQITTKPSGKIQLELQSNLKELFHTLQQNQPSLPEISGMFHSQLSIQLKNGEWNQSSLTSMVEKLVIGQFDIGNIQLKGSVKPFQLQIDQLLVTSEAGTADLTNGLLEFKKEDHHWTGEIKTHLRSDFLDLNELLIRLGIGDIPVELLTQSEFDCQGPILPDLQIQCTGKAHADHLEVRSGPTREQTIVVIDEFSTTGTVNISNSEVNYQAQIQVGNNQGQSSGKISFKDGFDISYSTSQFHFSNLKNLAHLKLEGHAALSGRTTGDSHSGQFFIQTEGKEIFFENYYLGNPKGLIRYESGKLYFEKISSVLQSSRFDADVIVDLKKPWLIVNGETTQADVADVIKAFDRIVTLPVELSGPVKAKIHAEGPLQFNKLTYQLTGQVSQGYAAGESYDSLEFDIEAQEGNVVARKLQLNKGSSTINLSGKGFPNGQIDFLVKADKFQLDESENVSKLGSNISGSLDLTMSMTGHVLSPDILLKSQVANLIIDEQEFPPSNLSLKLTKKSAEGIAYLLGNRLKCQFTIPYDDLSPFSLKATATDWNYATIFTLIGGGKLLTEYKTSVSGNIDLSSETGGFFKSTGKVLIDKVILKRGTLSLQNKNPMELILHSGVMSFNNFKVSGENSFIEFKGENFAKNNLNLKAEGQAPLRLFQIFLPFLQELGGTGNFKMSVGGTLDKPEILGQAQAKNAFVSLKGFPHPFEQVQTQIQFSHSKIIIPELRGTLAGGRFSGDGQIQIEGIRNLPTNIKARVENINLVVPDKVRTQGSADILFSGNWFPFTISGTYNVTGGLIDNEFEEQSGSSQISQSAYLPKMILQSAFDPLLLNIQVNIDKSMQIKNSKIEGTLVGNLQVKGPPTSPLLYGKVNMEKNSKIFFRDKIFDVQAGSVQFNDPKEINPDLYFTARSHVSDYDVNLLLQGNAKSPLIKLTSTPPLSEQDIISLLALGITSSKLEKGVQSKEQESSLLYQAGTALVAQSPLAKAVESLSGFNLEFTSNYNDTKNTNEKKITLSKNVTKKLKFSASHLTSEQSYYEVRLQYLFNPQFSAISSWEGRQSGETSKSTIDSQKENQGILGLDLEYKMEFR